MSNQASEDELRAEILTEFKQVHKLAPADYTENCTNIVMNIIRTEKLKAQTAILQEGISESKEFCGEDVDINLGWVSFKLNELQQSLNKLEAEL